MNVPTWAGFVGDFPDDQIEQGLEIEVFGGRNVLVALGEIFASLGCSVISAPESQGEQGWAFHIDYGGPGSVWCRVQSFHPVFWLLLENQPASRKDAAAYVELWRKFGNALEKDPRFRKVLWRPFEDGPPDWDDVEAASEPPKRTFDEEFPAALIEPKKPRAGCSSALFILVFVVWPISAGIGGVLYRENGPNLFERIGYVVIGVVLIGIGLGFLLLFVAGIRNSRREA